MSVLETVRQNRVNADKARQLDDMVRSANEQKVFDLGRNAGNEEAIAAVNRRLEEQAKSRALDSAFGTGGPMGVLAERSSVSDIPKGLADSIIGGVEGYRGAVNGMSNMFTDIDNFINNRE